MNLKCKVEEMKLYKQQIEKLKNNKYVFYFIFILFCLLIFYLVKVNNKLNYKDLLNNGKKTKAVIYNAELNLVNGGTIYKYKFYLYNNIYTGDLYLKKINSEFNINDTIDVIYLKDKPSRNISQYRFSEIYN